MKDDAFEVVAKARNEAQEAAEQVLEQARKDAEETGHQLLQVRNPSTARDCLPPQRKRLFGFNGRKGGRDYLGLTDVRVVPESESGRAGADARDGRQGRRS